MKTHEKDIKNIVHAEKILPIQIKQTQPIATDSKSDDPMSKYERFTSARLWFDAYSSMA